MMRAVGHPRSEVQLQGKREGGERVKDERGEAVKGFILQVGSCEVAGLLSNARPSLLGESNWRLKEGAPLPPEVQCILEGPRPRFHHPSSDPHLPSSQLACTMHWSEPEKQLASL